MVAWFSQLSSVIGLALLTKRLGRAFVVKPFAEGVPPDASRERVSIVVPSRNEEANLPGLLASLRAIEGHEIEIIVIDDESTDATLAIAQKAASDDPRIRVIRGEPRPDGWTGKNWACHQGYKRAKCDWLLFTDADTHHEKLSLVHALGRMKKEDLQLLSAAPFHRCEKFWEKILGPFQLLIFISAVAFSVPRPKRLFAIGQYLLFRREAYEKQGGHERIRGYLCDDLELAKNALEAGSRYRVESRRLFDVRMYPTFSEFIKGWRRNIRLGFRHASWLSPVEIFFVFAALSGSMRFFAADAISIILMLISLAFFGILQFAFGNFSILGLLLLPWNLAVFTFVSVMALVDLALARKMVWRGRSYESSAD